MVEYRAGHLPFPHPQDRPLAPPPLRCISNTFTYQLKVGVGGAQQRVNTYFPQQPNIATSPNLECLADDH
jgi:hypothetical protein